MCNKSFGEAVNLFSMYGWSRHVAMGTRKRSSSEGKCFLSDTVNKLKRERSEAVEYQPNNDVKETKTFFHFAKFSFSPLVASRWTFLCAVGASGYKVLIAF